MIDKNSKAVEEGARCRFYAETREAWLVGTVRAVATMGYFRGQARVDDGDPANADPHTNDFHVSAWVPSEHIELIDEAG